MDKIIVPIIVAIVSSNGIFAFVQFIINRFDYVKKIEDKQIFIDQGLIRTQLLILMADYPDRIDEIMRLAEQYFCKFKGNYYLSSLFKKYLDDKLIDYPQWFCSKHD